MYGWFKIETKESAKLLGEYNSNLWFYTNIFSGK